jgi:hypothetical protein
MKWRPPSQGHMKLNVDGFVEKTKNRGAMGVACRDDFGVSQGASAMVIDGVTNPTTIESYACREALDLTEYIHTQKFVVSSDCLMAINDINSSSVSGKHLYDSA